jgi:hypothetical protein
MKAGGIVVLSSLLLAAQISLCMPSDGTREESTSRILVLVPFNTKSHKNMFVPIIAALAKRVRVF